MSYALTDKVYEYRAKMKLEAWKALPPGEQITVFTRELCEHLCSHIGEVMFWTAFQARSLRIGFPAWFSPEEFYFPTYVVVTRKAYEQERIW